MGRVEIDLSKRRYHVCKDCDQLAVHCSRREDWTDPAAACPLGRWDRLPSLEEIELDRAKLDGEHSLRARSRAGVCLGTAPSYASRCENMLDDRCELAFSQPCTSCEWAEFLRAGECPMDPSRWPSKSAIENNPESTMDTPT